jgi:peptidoglycan/xylan/chitin deacetylase (PgdA/CDA1 family)
LRAITLEYHDVVIDGKFDASGFPGKAAASYKVEISNFKKQIDAISKAINCRPVSVLNFGGGGELEHPFFFSFDDGGSSAFTHIADILESFGWFGHFLIPVDYIGAPSFLDKEQIRALRNRGHVIGSHSCSHPTRMALLSWEEMLEEWRRSVQILGDILGEDVKVASVPGGHYSNSVAKAASLAGIKALFTSEPTTRGHYVDGCLVLGRFTVRRHTDPEFAASLASGKISSRFQQWLLWNLLKIAKSFGGELYLKVRKVFWSANG